ncbi:MAG: nicotinamide riboside transporter PnuC [Mycoplasmataceae bacterium]|nr:nicotinamide riboside transporter PnuC [Mycoplasmataceae bacterium]
MKSNQQIKSWWKYIIFFYDWTLFELLLLGTNLICAIIFLVLGLVGHPDNASVRDTLISFFANITNALCIILVAKKKISNFAWGLIAVVLLGVTAFFAKNTGTWILNWIFNIPVQFIGFYFWFKKTDKKQQVQVRHLTWWITLIVLASVIILTGLLGWVDSLPSVQRFWYGQVIDGNWYRYITDAAVLVISVVATVLMILRFSEQWILWLISDVMCIILWSINTNPQMIITWATALINSVYGLINWKRNN